LHNIAILDDTFDANPLVLGASLHVVLIKILNKHGLCHFELFEIVFNYHNDEQWICS
jgi:hypothetical protein